MIVSDIITRVRRTFGDEAAVQVQDADVVRWINDGMIEIVKNNETALQKTGFVNLVANQSVYSMPTDMLILRSLRYKFSDMLSYKQLKYYSLQEFDEAINGWDGTAFSAGNPVIFNMFENQVTLFPTPSVSVTSGLKVLYNQKPTDVVTTADSISLPLIYHNLLVAYCMWQASLMDEDLQPATLYQNYFAGEMQTLKARESQDAVATYPTITTLYDDL